MPAFNEGAMVSHSLAFFHRSAERWGPDWGPMNLLISKNDLNSNACEVYWLPFTAPAACRDRVQDAGPFIDQRIGQSGLSRKFR